MPESPTGRATYRLRSVCVDYATPAGPVAGARDITLDVPASGMTVLAGPSGSGKSTLLRVLGLVERPDRGTVELDGTDVAGLSHRRRRALRRDRISLVFQNPVDNLLPQLSVTGNLRAAAESAGHDHTTDDDILGELGLDGTGDWSVSALSGGQQQRLAFGCALARRTPVILADEPTSQLDDVSAERVLDVLRRLADHDLTIVVTSHDGRLIDLATHLVRLRDGALHDVPPAGDTRTPKGVDTP
ncbi:MULTISPECIES: ABC transporter ATP-binding protein [Prauserella salsuginis group]|uniref:ABC transporter ATP-binding protein n=1 Tax=Prauserella salsuginis TaxID=387889 RepID=A0ABW6G4H9_9PSEU|nr:MULTISPECIES: ATP-binding cassette domain-containing protein [Prauserella salsuginis group]MCR3718194.1 putative ABC transport system ATP-binding protein [Prauserella flava]MCR3732764.1 putative ABC transport system ATP-binding protein [Prauserella salsuginis]